MPLTFGLVVALGIAVFTKWKTTELRLILGKIPVPLLIAIIGAGVLPFYLTNDYSYSITAGLTLFMSLWLVATIAKDLSEKTGINIKRIAKKRIRTKRRSKSRKKKNQVGMMGGMWNAYGPDAAKARQGLSCGKGAIPVGAS